MTIELTMLAWSCVLGIAQAFATGQFATMEHGLRYNMGPRDEQKPPGLIGGRVERAFANYLQTFPFFAAAVLMAHVANRHGALTSFGAQLYFWARLIYVPLYAAGIPVVRTLAFLAGVAGIGLILYALT
jgi:uncharacterized MAPEG superfamily protein